jgi:Heterokaryon incompatibility protein (HET)
MASSRLELQSAPRTSEFWKLCNQCEALKCALGIHIWGLPDSKFAYELSYFNSIGPLDFNPTKYWDGGLVKEWTAFGQSFDVLLHSHVFRLYHPSPTKCPCCDHLRGVLQILMRKLEERGDYYIDLIFKPRALGASARNEPMHSYLLAELQDLRAILMIGTVQSDKYPGLFNPLSSTQLDFGFAKAALDECFESCKHEQRMAPKGEGFITHFVDVKRSCLVQSTLAVSYAALSYVWGSLQSYHDADLCCTKENLNAMQTSGYFLKIESLLPATIKDAISFIKKMGLQYLWIDRFCIVQDDYTIKHAQLNAMGTIYENAAFSIIATGDSIHSGLPGVAGFGRLSLRHYFTRSAFNIEDHEVQVRLQYPHSKTGNTWATRGWTFQEDLFTRRSFVFLQDTVVFLCSEKEWQEGTPYSLSLGWLRMHDEETHLKIRSYPDLRGLLASLRTYLKRELTYPCDSLAAFAGVLSAMTPFFPGGFHFGIPELCFTSALLWQAKGSDLKDRKKEAACLQRPVADLPTWSWARYSGTLSFSNLEDTYEGARAGTNTFQSRTIPTVAWYKLSEDSSRKQLINDAWNLYRSPRTSLGRRSSNDIPRGWIGDAQGFTYQDTYEYFKFPIPITLGDCGVSESVRDDLWSSRIWTRADRAFLWVSGNMLFADEISASRSPVGVISSWEGTSPADGCAEAIALSLGDYSWHSSRKCSEQYFQCELEWGNERFTRSRYRYYNVMLLEWADGIAERRGIGRVQELKWAALEKECIDVTLG